MSEWKARPTTYRGIQMRSRLEAAYAAYLDHLGETWTYEPNAFGSRRGQYLPDFRLAPIPDSGWWYVEVRPTLARAFPALSQMLIIRESEPDAWLQVAVPRAGWWLNKPYTRRWEWLTDRRWPV